MKQIDKVESIVHRVFYERDKLRSEVVELRETRDARRDAFVQEVRETLTSRGFWVPSEKRSDADNIVAIGKALDELLTESERLLKKIEEIPLWEKLATSRKEKLDTAEAERDELRAQLEAVRNYCGPATNGAYRECGQWADDIMAIIDGAATEEGGDE